MPTGSERVVESSMGTCCAFEVTDAHSLPHISAVGTAVENLHLKPNSGSLRDTMYVTNNCLFRKSQDTNQFE